MLSTLYIILTMVASMTTAEVTELLDLPLILDNGDLIIYANLTANSGREKYSIKELVSTSDSAVTGKIIVSNDIDSYDIHYQFDKSGKDSKTRLVVHGNACELYSYYEMTKSANLFGTKKPLRELMLLMGPSIIYRLDKESFVWTEVPSMTIRGVNMKGATTKIHETLKMTSYYKDKYDVQYGVKNPSRIEFSGYDPSTSSKSTERLILDIYLQSNEISVGESRYTDQLPAGIGCPTYIIERKKMPGLLTKYVRFTMAEDIQGAMNTRSFSEITASGVNLLMRLKTSVLGVKTEVIYDNKLGVIFTLEEGGECHEAMGDIHSPGRDSDGYFTLDHLFLVDGTFNYIGKTKLENRFSLPVHAWELLQFNADFEGKKVDKLIITQYFVEAPEDVIFDGYSLVRTMISIYDLDSSKKSYTLAKRILRDYTNFETFENEYELFDYFTFKDCKNFISDRKTTLSFKLGCEASNTDCIKFADRQMYKFREAFKNEIVLNIYITPPRIADIQYRPTDTEIEFDVTFLDKPNYDGIIKPTKMLVSSYTFEKSKTRTASNENECLDQLGHVYGGFPVGIYRPSDSFCGYLKKFKDLKEDTKYGQSCNVYIFPWENFFNIKKEVSLDEIQNSYLSYKFQTFSLKDDQTDVSFTYKILDIVILKQADTDLSESAVYYKAADNAKLKNGVEMTLTVPGISTFIDCLRVCENSEELDCNAFSFCTYSDSVDCRVSSLIVSNFTDSANKEQDSKCNIFSMNDVRFYSYVSNRKFKNQVSTSISQSLTACAQMCLTSEDCLSLQYCGDSCSFNSFYTDSSTEYDEECTIYYPKVSHAYGKTGNKIVFQVMHVEKNLNLDQCASLCHGWSDGQVECKSFNYCPRAINQFETICSLTKYSVKSSDTNVTEGGHCSNYELKIQSNGNINKQSEETEVIKGTSGSSAFGVIMLFMLVGALFGFAAPFAYERFKRKTDVPKIIEKFAWSRQVNEQTESVN